MILALIVLLGYGSACICVVCLKRKVDYNCEIEFFFVGWLIWVCSSNLVGPTAVIFIFEKNKIGYKFHRVWFEVLSQLKIPYASDKLLWNNVGLCSLQNTYCYKYNKNLSQQ